MDQDLNKLMTLLTQRENVIADHTWRDRAPEQHLEALKAASLAISHWHQSHKNQIPATLNHYLTQCSFEKAMKFCKGDTLRHL